MEQYMTSTVKIEAHCSDDKQVAIIIVHAETDNAPEEIILENGQDYTCVVYDDIRVAVKECMKKNWFPDDSSPAIEPTVEQVDIQDTYEKVDNGK
jgi:hypothetical protein